MATLGQALHQVLSSDHPTLLPAVTDDHAREWEMAAQPSSVEAVLDFLTVETNALADAVEHTPSEAWTRTGVVAGAGRDISALGIAQEAVATGAAHLRAAERAIDAASRG